MKLSFIYEATIDQVQNKVPLWVNKYFNGDQERANEIINNALPADPTKGKYTEWIIKQVVKELVRVPEDNHRINDALVKFDQVKKRLDNKDINAYGLSELEDVVDQRIGVTSSIKKHDYSNLNGVEVFKKDGPFVTLAVYDSESLKQLGEGTKWCTRGSYKDCMAEDYLEEHGVIYVVLQDGRPVMQYTSDYNQIMDIKDQRVTDKKLLSLLPPADLENDDLNVLVAYAAKVIQDRWPELEPLLIQGHNFPEVYNEIVEHADFCRIYAEYCIKGRWSVAEHIIIQDPRSARFYAERCIKGRWPEAEQIILTNEYESLYYAVKVLKRRWLEAESKIMENSFTAAEYKKRFGIGDV